MIDIPGYNGVYKFDEEGNVYKDLGHRIVQLKPCINNWGYLVFTCSKAGVRKSFKVHRVVAEHYVFNPKPNEYSQINHKDGNKLNNNRSNLEWCNNQENNLHKSKIGLGGIRGKHISVEDRKSIVRDFLSGIGLTHLARKYKRGISSIFRITRSYKQAAL